MEPTVVLTLYLSDQYATCYPSVFIGGVVPPSWIGQWPCVIVLLSALISLLMQCYCCSGFTTQRARVMVAVDSPHIWLVLLLQWIHHTVPVLLLQWIHHTESQCFRLSGFTTHRASVIVAAVSPHRGSVLLLQWIHHTEGQCYCCSGFTTQMASVIVAVASPHRRPVIFTGQRTTNAYIRTYIHRGGNVECFIDKCQSLSTP